jgi:hypothetical protein
MSRSLKDAGEKTLRDRNDGERSTYRTGLRHVQEQKCQSQSPRENSEN